LPGGGHVLQSYEWGEFKRTSGWRPIRLVLEREDGEVAGVGQFLAYDTGPFVPGVPLYCTKGPGCPGTTRRPSGLLRGRTGSRQARGAHTVKIEPEVFDWEKNVRDLLGEIGSARPATT
jgi:hypothetical protein